MTPDLTPVCFVNEQLYTSVLLCVFVFVSGPRHSSDNWGRLPRWSQVGIVRTGPFVSCMGAVHRRIHALRGNPLPNERRTLTPWKWECCERCTLLQLQQPEKTPGLFMLSWYQTSGCVYAVECAIVGFCVLLKQSAILVFAGLLFLNLRCDTRSVCELIRTVPHFSFKTSDCHPKCDF